MSVTSLAASLRGELTGIAVSQCAIGDGVNVENIKKCFDILVDINYDGVVSLECEGQGGPMIEKSLAFVRELVADANKRIGSQEMNSVPGILITEENHMGKIYLGINMEFVRHHDKPFAWGVEKAAEIGYQYIEPMVHLGRELLSEARYFHSVSMYDDPRWVKDLCDKHKIKLSGLSSHTPLVQTGNQRGIPEAGNPLGIRCWCAGGEYR